MLVSVVSVQQIKLSTHLLHLLMKPIQLHCCGCCVLVHEKIGADILVPPCAMEMQALSDQA